jgi:hypothetical protein
MGRTAWAEEGGNHRTVDTCVEQALQGRDRPVHPHQALPLVQIPEEAAVEVDSKDRRNNLHTVLSFRCNKDRTQLVCQKGSLILDSKYPNIVSPNTFLS